MEWRGENGVEEVVVEGEKFWQYDSRQRSVAVNRSPLVNLSRVALFFFRKTIQQQTRNVFYRDIYVNATIKHRTR